MSIIRCIECRGKSIKKGKIKGIQCYQCKAFGCFFQNNYLKPKIEDSQYVRIIKLNNEGCGISSIGGLLHISKSSVQQILLKIAGKMEMKKYQEENKRYEIDELRTYCGNRKKECWLIYAINRKSRQVINFFVGKRTKENVNRVGAKQ